MAVAYKSAGAGAMTETSGATLKLPCPATVDANDILIAHVVVWGTTYSPTTPDGWTLLFGPYGLGTGTPTARAWVYGKLATGNEDGSKVSFGTIASTTGRMGRIYSFSGYESGTIEDVVPSASYAGDSSETDPVIQSVTTTVAGAKAIALISQDDNNYHSGLGDVTGGTWAEAVSDYVSSSVGPAGGCLQLQVGTPTSDPGTIAGGTVAGNDDEANTICFEIRPKTPNSPPTVELNTPTDEEEISDYTPELEFTGTDDDDDDVEYEVQVATDDLFTASEIVTCATNTSGSTAWSCYDGQIERFGQSFEGDGNKLYSATFNLAKTGSPTGNAYVKIYAHSGTFGTSSVPTGEPLAVSDAFDVSTLSGSQTYTEILFSGANRITLEDGTYYCVIFDWADSGDSSNKITFYLSTSDTCDGNFIEWISGLNWTYTGGDCRFTVKTEDLVVGTEVCDSSTQENNYYAFTDADNGAVGQTFTGNGEVLNSVKFKLYKTGSPTGNAYVRIYEHTGTFGTGGKPTGSALAESSALDVSTLTTTATETTFTFTGSNKITLVADTHYCVCVEYTNGTLGSDYLKARVQYLDNLHAGNSIKKSSGYWTYDVYGDVYFYVYTDQLASLIIDVLSTEETGFSAGASHPTASGEMQSYTVQDTLEQATYYWRVRALDPSGSNTWGDWSPVRSFTISGTAASSDRLLYTKGKAVASSDRLLYTRGKLTNSSDRSLYSKGGLAGSSDRLLYTKGKAVASSDRLLYTRGKLTNSSDRSLYSKGGLAGSSDRLLYSKGISTGSTDRGLYTKGKLADTGERLLYTKSSASSSSDRLIYSDGVSTGTSERALYFGVVDTDSSERSLYLIGSINGSSERSLYLQGSLSSNSERGLLLEGKPVIDERSLYLKSISSGYSNRTLYIHGSIGEWSEKDLYITGSTSGASLRGIYTVGSLGGVSEKGLYLSGIYSDFSETPLYIGGLDTDESERGLYLNAAIYGNSEFSMFIRGTWRPWVDKSVEYDTIYKDKGVVSGSSFNKTIINKTDTFSKRDTSEGSVWIDEKASVINNFTRKL